MHKLQIRFNLFNAIVNTIAVIDYMCEHFSLAFHTRFAHRWPHKVQYFMSIVARCMRLIVFFRIFISKKKQFVHKLMLSQLLSFKLIHSILEIRGNIVYRQYHYQFLDRKALLCFWRNTSQTLCEENRN